MNSNLKNGPDYHKNLFLSLLMFSGGIIHGYKKIKSIIYLLSKRYPDLIKYKFDMQFFGPYSKQLVNDLEDMYWHHWLECRLQPPEKDSEPIHHLYSLSYIGQNYVQIHLSDLEKWLFEKGVEDIKDLSSTILALEILPTQVALNMSLVKSEEDLIKDPFYIDDEISNFVLSNYSMSFDKEIVNKLIDWYEYKNINCLPLETPSTYKITIDSSIAPALVHNRYEYLRLSEDDIENFKERYRKNIEKELEVYPLKDIAFNKSDLTNVKNKIESILYFFEKSNNLRKANEKLDQIFKLIEFLLAETENKKEGLQMTLWNVNAKISVYPDYKKAINWREDYMANIYHFLQPLERAFYLKYYQ